MTESLREMSARLARYDRNHRANLVAKRRKIGWSQKDLADVMGVTVRKVRKIEAYWGDPRLSDLRRYEACVHWALSGLEGDDG